MSLPTTFTLSAREGEHEDDTDIELRSPDEKFTVATVYDDRFVTLFLAAPDMLAACEMIFEHFNDTNERGVFSYATKSELNTLREAIGKARGK